MCIWRIFLCVHSVCVVRGENTRPPLLLRVCLWFCCFAVVAALPHQLAIIFVRFLLLLLLSPVQSFRSSLSIFVLFLNPGLVAVFAVSTSC